jgi:hypothetical protein
MDDWRFRESPEDRLVAECNALRRENERLRDIIDSRERAAGFVDVPTVQPDAALMTADERRLEDYMAMWKGTRDRLQRVLAAIRRCEVSHTGMSYGDEKSGDVTGYTKGWGDCLKAIKKADSTADQQSALRCPTCRQPIGDDEIFGSCLHNGGKHRRVERATDPKTGGAA